MKTVFIMFYESLKDADDRGVEIVCSTKQLVKRMTSQRNAEFPTYTFTYGEFEFVEEEDVKCC